MSVRSDYVQVTATTHMFDFFYYNLFIVKETTHKSCRKGQMSYYFISFDKITGKKYKWKIFQECRVKLFFIVVIRFFWLVNMLNKKYIYK